MIEIWKDIKGFEGDYKISNKGVVMSVNFRRGGISKVLKCDDSARYSRVTLRLGGLPHRFFVHRLVALHFLKTSNKPHVNHIDGDKFNNVYINLEWCTQSENMIHAVKTGLFVPREGALHHNIKPVVMIDKVSKYVIKEFLSISEAAKYSNVSTSAIQHCVSKLTKTSAGYIWEYAK